MKENANMIKLWSLIDDIMLDNEYYDDDLQNSVCEISLERLTEHVLAATRQKEIRFLGTEVIKSECQKFYTDYPYRHEVLSSFKLY